MLFIIVVVVFFTATIRFANLDNVPSSFSTLQSLEQPPYLVLGVSGGLVNPDLVTRHS